MTTACDYYESAEDLIISHKRALQELRLHGIEDPTDFYAEVGYKSEYEAQRVLSWLGY